eukprot:979330_1
MSGVLSWITFIIYLNKQIKGFVVVTIYMCIVRLPNNLDMVTQPQEEIMRMRWATIYPLLILATRWFACALSMQNTVKGQFGQDGTHCVDKQIKKNNQNKEKQPK